jgi:type IV pilus assembly protein PilA
MLNSLKERFDREDEGFTLIELMVVVLIIAILLAIAIPTFLGARNSANQRAAQSDLRNGLTAEQTYWTNNQVFAGNLSTIEPSLNWVTAWPTATTGAPPHTVLVSLSDSNNIVEVTALGKDGHCWTIAQVNDPSAPNATSTPPIPADGTYYNESAPASGGGCAGPTAPAAAATAGSATGNIGATFYTSF